MLADVTFSTEGIAIISALLAALTGVVGYLFRELMSSKDKAHAAAIAEHERDIKELEGIKKSYQEIAAESFKTAKDTANMLLAEKGKAPVNLAPPVVSESHSPSTKKQREDAYVATLRASLAKVKETLDLPPREEPPHAVEPSGPMTPAEEQIIETIAGRVEDKVAQKIEEIHQGVVVIDETTKAIEKKLD